MTRRKSLDELKNEYIGKIYGFLTIDDVIYTFDKSNHRIITFICTCKCGNIKIAPKKLITNGHISSCGCYRKSKEFNEYKHNYYIEHPEVVDKIRESNIIYYSDEAIRKEISDRNKQWHRDNPQLVNEQHNKHLEWIKNNKDKLSDIGNKISTWRVYNKSKCEEIRNKIIDWNKNNRSKILEKEIKHRQWYLDNPDKVETMNKNHVLWCKNNRLKMMEIASTRLIQLKDRRINSEFEQLLNIIDREQTQDLISGNIRSNDYIRTLCPGCGNYDVHMLSNVFIFSTSSLKLGHAPLCRKCRASMISSRYEEEILNYISTFYNEPPIRNNRDIIFPLELDLYYPNKRIGVEFNGDYWHSDLYKDRKYHYNKFIKCKEKDILLVSIFESDWISNNNVIKEYLHNVFNNELHDISFNNDRSLMNNNYPIPDFIQKCDFSSYIEDKYITNDYTVFTCGYSLLN